MKIKLDENVHGDVQEALTRRGHDATTVHEEGLRGRPDDDVAAAVRAEERCLVTFDLDFADPRRFPPGSYHGILVLRLRIPTSDLQMRTVSDFFETHSERVPGRLWILDETRARDWTP